MSVEQTKRIIMDEIKDGFPFQQMKVAKQLAMASHIERALMEFKKEIIHGAKALIEFALRDY
jgi:hypothetical protein